MSGRKAFPENVPGDFYVEENCCTMCEVPFTFAPSLFGSCRTAEGYQHCFVKQQPGTADEMEQMIDVIQCAELQCIRYRGHDRLIQLRLVEEGQGFVCDELPLDLQEESDCRDAERKRLLQEHPPRWLKRWWRFWW